MFSLILASRLKVFSNFLSIWASMCKLFIYFYIQLHLFFYCLFFIRLSFYVPYVYFSFNCFFLIRLWIFHSIVFLSFNYVFYTHLCLFRVIVSCLECGLSNNSGSPIADTKPHPNQSLDFS